MSLLTPLISVGTLSVRIVEAKLTVNASKFTRMRVRVEVSHGQQTLSTKIGDGESQLPQWNEVLVFTLSPDPTAQIRVFHCPFLLSPVLLGHCSVPLPLASRRTRSGWWELRNTELDSVGSIRLSFGFEAEGGVGTGNGGDCGELREKVRIKREEIELEREELEYLKLKCKRKAAKRAEEERKYLSKVCTLVPSKDLKVDSNSPTSPSSLPGPDESERRQKSLALREDLLIDQLRQLEEEKAELSSEKADLQHLREEINTEVLITQSEKRGLAAHRAVLSMGVSGEIREIRISASHDTLPSLDVNMIEQWREIREIRATLGAKEAAWEKDMRDVEFQLKGIRQLRKDLSERSSFLSRCQSD